jgi:hypothetical protein
MLIEKDKISQKVEDLKVTREFKVLTKSSVNNVFLYPVL